MMRIPATIFAAVLVAAAATCSPARAEKGTISFGHLALTPILGVQKVYDDNIFYGNGSSDPEEKKESDWITHVLPGLLLNYTLDGRGTVKLGYGGDYAYYSKNSFNDWKRHKGLFDVDYHAPGGLIAKIRNVYTKSEDPFGSLNEYSLGRKTKRWDNDLAAAVGFKFSDRFKMLTYYNRYKQDYKSDLDASQDYYSGEAGIGLEGKVADKTWAFLRYHDGSLKYFTHRDGVTRSNDAAYDWRRVNTGLNWDDGARFAGELNFGYQWNSFKNKFDENKNPYKDENDLIAATSVAYKQTALRTIRFSVVRALRQSGAGSSGYFTNTAFGLSVSQKIRTKFLLKAGYAFAKNKYNDEGSFVTDASYSPGKKDTIHLVQTSLKYAIKEWLAAGVEYNYLKDHSSDSLSSYKINRLMFSLEMKPESYR
jgi:hypothetical protein